MPKKREADAVIRKRPEIHPTAVQLKALEKLEKPAGKLAGLAGGVGR